MTKAAKIDLVFFIAAVILSLHSVPYELRVCYPPPDHGDDSPMALAAGVASTPYQYRVLVPWIVRAATDLRAIRPESQMAMFRTLQVIALVLLGVVFRRYLSMFIADRVLGSVMALTLYAILPFNYFNLPYYPYDVPSVMFFTLGLILIHDERWWWFYPLFIVATLNRETSIFLAVVTAFAWYDRYAWPKLTALVASQAAIWIAIKAALWILYQNNRWMGYGLYEYQLKVNIATLVESPLMAVMALATWACLWLAVVVWYPRIRHVFMRRTLWTIPVFIAGMFVAGVIIELRIYGEMLPMVLAAAWVAFLDVVKESLTRSELVWVPDTVIGVTPARRT
jgi:hypothetical protein